MLRVVFPCILVPCKYPMRYKSRRCRKLCKFWFVCRRCRKIEKWVEFESGWCRFRSTLLLPKSLGSMISLWFECRNRWSKFGLMRVVCLYRRWQEVLPLMSRKSQKAYLRLHRYHRLRYCRFCNKPRPWYNFFLRYKIHRRVW